MNDEDELQQLSQGSRTSYEYISKGALIKRLRQIRQRKTPVHYIHGDG
jgi:hypothetical protein